MAEYKYVNIYIDADNYNDGINTLIKDLRETWQTETIKVEVGYYSKSIWWYLYKRFTCISFLLPAQLKSPVMVTQNTNVFILFSFFFLLKQFLVQASVFFISDDRCDRLVIPGDSFGKLWKNQGYGMIF